MSDKPARIRGTQDMIGEEAERFDQVVAIFQRVRKLYGFRPVHIPIFEATGVFARTLGETTDVVSKEMYTFEDRSGDSLTLRPEFTAGIARAYISNGWQQHGVLKLAAWGPAFRYERPQKGRFRQFHQLDAETIGTREPGADVELLCFAQHLIEELGIAGSVTLQLNTLGDPESRAAWQRALVDHFERHRDKLSADSRERLERNPLRILDSKASEDRALVDEAPEIDAYLSDEAKGFFADVTKGLEASGVAFERNPKLVRGLDYYRHTAFEFVTDALGAQGTVLAGGRYDGLIEALGGPSTPAVGWAAGIERLAMLVDAPPASPIDAALLPLGEMAAMKALEVARTLRHAGLAVESLAQGSIKKRMQRAGTSGARYALIIGDEELMANAATVKRLEDGRQEQVAFEQLVEALAR